MSQPEKKKESALPAILGWGGLALFAIGFAWIVISQLRASEEWSDRFRLVAENVPSVLDSECARMIFSTGKAIHFLLNRCKVTYQVRTPFLAQTALADPAALLAGPFRSWLSQLHAEVSRALVETLLGQFHLRHHLQSVKYFFLAGKGDFIQQLYDTLKEKLSQKKQEITDHVLSHANRLETVLVARRVAT